MSDLISRQAAISSLNDWRFGISIGEGTSLDERLAYDILTQVIEGLERLPSAQPEQRWISCSERLPETPTGNKDYEWDGEDIAADEYIVMIKNAKHPTSLWWTGKEWIDVYAYESYCVIAWMPLPEPYKDFSEYMNEPEEEE